MIDPPPAPAAVQSVADRAAQTGLRTAEQALAQAQRAMQLAQSSAGVAEAVDAGETGDLQTFLDVIGLPGRGAARSLIVRTSTPEPGVVTRLQEDMTVMQRILTKAVERELGREGRDAAMGIVLSALPGSRNPQSLYLEGYGALFFMNVKFPLIAPPTTSEEKPEKPTDTTWEETKRELYGPRSGKVRVFSAPGSDSAPEYNPEQVQALKKELLEALKNATNIRDLRPEENVTVAVIGGRASATARVRHDGRASGYSSRSEVNMAEDVRGSGRESTMSLRAKKADLDAFAKGSINLEQFEKRVAIATY
jgi:hypothetical protein